MHDTLTHSYTSSPLLRLTCAKGSSLAQEVMDTHMHTQTHKTQTHINAGLKWREQQSTNCRFTVSRWLCCRWGKHYRTLMILSFSCYSWIQLPETEGFQGNSFVKQSPLILQLNTSTFNSVWERNPLKLVAVLSEEIALVWLSFKLILECIKQLAVVFLELVLELKAN